MISFASDYVAGAHPTVLQRLVETNMEQLKDMFIQKGYKFFIESPTNQQFIILENGEMERLGKEVEFCFWEKYDDNHTVVRFATSWSTTGEDMETLRTIVMA